MLFSLSLVIAIFICILSLKVKKIKLDYIVAIGMTLVLTLLLSEKISLVGSSIISSLLLLMVFLLISTSFTIGQSRKRKVYKPFSRRIFIFILIVGSVAITYYKFLIPNITFNLIEFNEDYVLLLIIFFASLNIRSTRRLK